MNSLSWLIYAIEVVGNIKFALIGAIVIMSVVGFLGFGPASEIGNGAMDKWWRIVTRRFIPVGIAFVVLLVFIPSERTVTMIAASEVGERVIKTEAGQSVVEGAKGAMKDLGGLGSESVGLLRACIQKQTQELQKDVKK